MPVRIKMAAPEGAVFDAGKKLVAALRTAGFPAFWVGGAVRDLRLEVLPEDIDIVTAATPDEVAAIFPDTEQVGACFGVGIVKLDGFTFEVATCREERGYSDGRRPDKVRYTKNFESDIQRRDFTVNAMLFEPVRGELIDYVGALADIDDHNIRAVGNPMVRFQEDYLRMLRAVRFAARFDFNLAPSTFTAITKLADKVKLLAPERVRAELEIMLTGVAPSASLQLLKSTGLLAVVLPEVDALSGVTQAAQYHPEGDAWRHTLLMFEYLEEPATPELAWSLLFHDIGKAPTRTLDENKVPHFYGHEAEGARMAAARMEQLRFPNALALTVEHAVRNHMRFANVTQMREAKLKRLLAEPDFAMELELHRLDCKASHGLMAGYEFLCAEQEKLAECGAYELPPPLVSGDDLIAKGYVPGPRFREILEAVMDEQLTDALADKTAALAWIEREFPPEKESEAEVQE